jgi:hypothetical protein
MLFCQDQRDSLRRENPGIKPHDVARRCGDLWKELPDEQRAVYHERSSVLKVEFDRAHAELKRARGDERAGHAEV